MSRYKTVGIVSLSSGVIGADFVRHELELGVRRLENYGLRVKFTTHALDGVETLQAHPELRAADWIEAYEDPEIDFILSAIGGDDTYRLAPFLFENDALKKAAAGKDKPFLGFSDTTTNHLMLHKLGIKSFYGQAFLSDVCELSREMLPYTRHYFEELLHTGTISEIRPSPLWYESRTDFGASQLGTEPVAHENGGFELLKGAPVFRGKILGGCIDTIYDYFDGERYADSPALCAQYGLFPPAEDWQGRILLLESSEEKPGPEKYRRALGFLKDAGVLEAVSGILIGKPMDGAYDAEYRALLKELTPPETPVLCNIPIGHGTPRCILPFGIDAEVDAEKQRITFAKE